MAEYHPFSRPEIRSLVLLHAALLAGAALFGGAILALNLRNRGIGPGLIPGWVTALAYADLLLPFAALAASRAYLRARLSGASRRLLDRRIHIEAFKSRVRSAYLLRAAMTGIPALLGGLGALMVALDPGDIFAAPAIHLAHFQGAFLFLAETLRVTPTEARMEKVFRDLHPD